MGRLEVLIGDLQIVLRRDGLRVADPLTDDMHGEFVGQIRLPGAAKVLEQQSTWCCLLLSLSQND